MARLVYKLTGQKKSDESSLGYYAEGILGKGKSPYRPMPVTRSLPRFHRIIETDENGKKRARQIAYAPSENTIYVDEFINPKAKVVRPKFKKGFLIVDDNVDPHLPIYLDKIDSNGSKKDRNKKAAVKFIQLNKENDAMEMLQAEEEVAKRLDVFWSLPDTRLKAISNSVGLPTLNQSPTIWKLKLLGWAKHNVEKFEETYKNPEIEYIDIVTRAEETNVLKFESHTWFYNSVPVLKVAHSKNKYIALAEKLINDPQLYRAISNEVDEKMGNNTKTIGEEAKTVNFDELDSKALLEMAKKHKVVKYEMGVGYEIIETGVQFGGRSTDSAVEAIEGDDLLRKQLQAQLNKV